MREAVLDALDQGREAKACQLAVRYSPHSLVARHVLADQAPQLLPQPEQELQWLLSDLLLDLGYAESSAKAPGGSRYREKVQELLWAFAVLWRDPPAGTPDAVEAFLDDGKILEPVRKLRKRLPPV